VESWILIAVAIVVAGLLLWVFWGRTVVGWLDRFFLADVRQLAVIPLEVREREIALGNKIWPIDSGIEIRRDQGGWPSLVSEGKSFCGCFGEDDQISMTTCHSRLFWPRFFEINFLGGTVSRWRRHAFDRLVWKKKSGQQLEIVWRHQEWFYRRSGWCDQYDFRVVAARIDMGPMEPIAVRYLRTAKGWGRDSYRLEDRGVEDGLRAIAVIHRDDENSPHPGAGKSVTLLIDSAGKVVREIGGQ
jgi:hypothetical protein